MKCAVIFYHRNIRTIYPREWIDECIDSIRAQSLSEFDVLELNYGEGSEQLCGNVRPNYRYLEHAFDNHIHAMNFLIDEAFDSGYDVVFNTNMDDRYDSRRFELQLKKIEEGYHLVSSNFYYMDGGRITNTLNMTGYGDIGRNLAKQHNVIAHPAVTMHSYFWKGLGRYQTLLGYEDLDLWQRGYHAGKKFYICEEYLLYYRIHKKQVTQSYDANGKRK